MKLPPSTLASPSTLLPYLPHLLLATVCLAAPSDIPFERATQVEQALIEKFAKQGEFATFEDMKQDVGAMDESFLDFRHYNFVQMTAKLKSLRNEFRNISALYSAGSSVENRELWVLVVSKYPEAHHKGVPEFKYVANMHGNEVSGRVFLIYLAELLLRNYETNAWIRNLLDTTRIHLMPSMNPDGYERSLEGDDSGVRGRTNANGFDLNRNFPPRFTEVSTPGPIQPETAAIMSWTRSIPFVLSANLHGGTAIVNYPFDDSPLATRRRRQSFYSPAPDNELFVRLAYTYARAHERMWMPGPRCIDTYLNYDTDPRSGIVNGAEWYVVSGGMQDWNYVHTNCMELTVEINCIKFPEASKLRPLWEENKYALLEYISQIHNAVHGTVVDAATRSPIPNATISIDNESKIFSSYGEGEFWRLVNQGEYTVTVDHPDYQPESRHVSITRDQRSAELHFRLQRIDDAQVVKDSSFSASYPIAVWILVAALR